MSAKQAQVVPQQVVVQPFEVVTLPAKARRTAAARPEWQPDPRYIEMEQLVEDGKISENQGFVIKARATADEVKQYLDEILAIGNQKDQLSNNQLFVLTLSGFSIEQLSPFENSETHAPYGHITKDFLVNELNSPRYNIFCYSESWKPYHTFSEEQMASKPFRLHVYQLFRGFYSFESEIRASIQIFDTLRRFSDKKNPRYGNHRTMRLICAWASKGFLEALQSKKDNSTYWKLLQTQAKNIGLLS